MDINQIRAEVMRRQQAANAKVARLRRKGVQIGGTDYDVRRDPSAIQKYNRRQLNAYRAKLDSFIDRNNAFIAGAEGAPLRRSTWQAYTRVEKQLQAKVNAHYNSVKGTFIPRAGKDVEGFDNTMRRKGTGGVKAPMEFTPIQAIGVTSDKHLQEIVMNNAKKLAPGYLPRELKKQRYQMLQSLTAYGDPKKVINGEEVSLNQLANSLTDEQLDTLWNYTDAPRDLFSDYNYLKLLAEGKADEGLANIHDESADDAWEWIEFAANLPPRGKTK